ERGTANTAVWIKPTLIRKGQRYRLHFITEGSPALLADGSPDVECTNPIADVEVRKGIPAMSGRIYAAISIQAACLIFAGGFIASPHLSWPKIVIGAILLLAAIAIGGEIVTAWRRRPSWGPPRPRRSGGSP